MRSRITNSTLKAFAGRRAVFFAASAAAVAASAWEFEHRRIRRADLTDEESDLRVEKLSDLRYEPAVLDAIESGLRDEWGEFAFLGFADVRDMLDHAGETTFVVVERTASAISARGIVQTILTDVHGDAALLQETYPDFAALTSPDSWKRSRSRGGDTAVLLQITTLVQSKRGGGVGSLLRNAVLNMLDGRIAYALTTTPVDGAALTDVNVEDPKTYTAAMRFHARGGAAPARTLPGYKLPSGDPATNKHGNDVVMMRYARDESGEWPAPRPEMRLRSMGPMQLRAARTLRRLKQRSRASRASRVRQPHLPGFTPGSGVLSGLKARAAHLFHRNHRGEDEAITPGA
jgi:hypothetical protein